MGFVDLRERPGDEPRVGWEENGELVGSARLQRVDDDTVELVDLRGEAAAEIVAGVADRVAAARLVVRGTGGYYEVAIEPVVVSEEPRPRTLAELEAAIAAAWCAETAERPDLWDEANPARDQCGVTALLVRELLGGDILVANVVRDGRRVERHAWNLLPSGLTVDLTRRQFTHGEQFEAPQVADACELANRHRLAYEQLRSRVGV
jgi:hypothetical protein